MINRRFLRIKAMQALYAYFQSDSKDLVKVEKELFVTIDKIYELYFYLLALLADLQHVSWQSIEDKKNKKLPTQDDLNPNTKFTNNLVFTLISKNTQLENEFRTKKISWQNEMELVRKIFSDIKNSDLYKDYMSNTKTSITEDKEFVAAILEDIIFEHELLNSWIEEKNIHWSDDFFVAMSTLIKTIEHIEDGGKLNIPELYKNKQEDQEFLSDLLAKCVVNDEMFQGLITDKTQNWDPDRIAMMDFLLMKMALSEVMFFPNIPIKVSLNEYIEISKQYSTPKSKLFINGVLDKIVAELRADDKINKSGRGLVEN